MSGVEVLCPLAREPWGGPFGDVPLLLQTANGNVEAKVVCFYRRRDISSALIALADKHASESRPRVGGPAFPAPPQARSPALEATCTACSASPPPPLLHLWPRVRGAQPRWGFMGPGVCLSPQGIGGSSASGVSQCDQF